jgi:enediyne biosynthesis protein E4
MAVPVAGMFVFTSCSNNKQTPPGIFQALPASQTHIDFENIPTTKNQLGILYYINYYSGGGVATGDFNNDGLTDIYFSANNKGSNKLYLNKGNFNFQDITEKAGVAGSADWCSGVTLADINADGWLDIYVCAISKKHGLTGHNLLYINNGATADSSVTFTESSAQYGLDFSGFSTQAAFFDYDHDGDLDCYLLNQSDHPHQYIVDTSHRRIFDPLAGDRLFRNDGHSREKIFTDVTAQAGIYESYLGFGLGLAVADVNNDGWEDIYIGNDFHENDYYYVNNHDGTFTESGAQVFNHYSRFSMGNDIADFNNDGNLDILTVDMLPPDEKTVKTYGSDERVDIYGYKIVNNGYQPQFSRNCLQQNNGDGAGFSDIGLIAGVAATDWSWTPLMADFDNDGCKDIFVASGIVKRTADLDYVKFISDLAKERRYSTSNTLDEKAIEKMPDGRSYCFMFKGNGKGKFTDESTSWGIAHEKGYYTAAAYADLDNDGDLDIIVNPIHSKGFVYQNNSAHKNYLQVKFHGDSLNTLGIGAKAYVFQKGKMQYEQLMLTRGFQSSSFERLHFGLDSLAGIDSVLIVWPGDAYQVLKNVTVNKLLIAERKEAIGKFEQSAFFPKQAPELYSIPAVTKTSWKHKEDAVSDFNTQYLIPHALSIRGPKIAVGDVNKDGLDDMFACGATGQAGQLMIQARDGKFTAMDTALFQADAACEDVDACFFDANNDSWPDLYVVSGGNKLSGNNPALLDRLYLNDGKGHFTKTTNSLPQLYANKSCVSAADIDGDGDIDIFTGVLANADAYGLPQTSYLLLNDGHGTFKAATQDVIALKDIGMVTASAIADVNNDGKKDLIVAGEWMPVTVFINNQNKFTATKPEAGSGLWQCVSINDVNEDGFPDILAGNWGLNSKLTAGKTGPLKLYVGDYDNNGKTETLLTYTIGDKEYPFLPKDEIEQVLPMVKKKFLYYTDYAGKTIQEVFDVNAATVLPLKAEDLATAVFINDGKGNFKRQDLPMSLQLSPVFAFQSLKQSGSFISGGNFFGVLPYEGQYDAAALVCFDVNKGKTGDELVKQSTIMINARGQIRDLKWLHTANNEDILVVARNNGTLLFYGTKPTTVTK